MLLDDVLSLLERLAELASAAKLNTAADELRIERIPALKEGKLSVVVLGEFNHGKSTLVNALLGGEVLPVGITPTTAQITRVYPGEPGRVLVRFDDESEEELAREQLDELVREENDRVREIVVYDDHPLLQSGVVFVDTPGVNDISKQRVEVTYGIVPKADMVLMVLDATQILKRSELRFIEERLLTGMRSRLVFVLGKMDRLDAEEGAEVESYARERLEGLLGPVHFFPLSARQAGRGGDKGFDQFERWLNDFLQSSREQVLLDSALGAGMRSSNTVLGALQIKRRGYHMERSELQAKVESVRDKLVASRRALTDNLRRIKTGTRDIAQSASQNIKDFSQRFVAALPREIEKATPKEIKTYLPGFLEDQLKRALEDEGRRVARELEALAEEIIAITNENMRETIQELAGELGLNPEEVVVDVDARAFDVSVFALGAFGVSILVFINTLVGGLITVATPVIAFLLRDRLQSKVKEQAAKVAIEAVEGSTAKAEEALKQTIEDFGQRLHRFVEDAGDRLYRQIEEALESVLAEREVKGSDNLALEGRAKEIEASVREIRESLSQRRDQLWAESLAKAPKL